MIIAIFLCLALFLGGHVLYQFLNTILHPVHLLVDVAVICVLWHLAVKVIDWGFGKKPQPPV